VGLIEKGITRHRTREQTSSVAVTDPWDQHGVLTTAAIVRAAACTLAQKKLSSSAFRGRDAFGINSSRSSSASSVWVEQVSSHKWTISLGVSIHSYRRALDWQLIFAITDEPAGNRSVTVSTGAVLTKDGSQIHKNEFSETRDLVLTGLALGRAPSLAPEEAITVRSRERVPSPMAGLRDGVERSAREIHTTLPVSDIKRMLERLPGKRVHVDESSWRLKVGPSGVSNAQYIAVSIEDRGNQRVVRTQFDIVLGPIGAINVITVKDALFHSAEFLNFLTAEDPELTSFDPTVSNEEPS
jgi:hypothetical protein